MNLTYLKKKKKCISKLSQLTNPFLLLRRKKGKKKKRVKIMQRFISIARKSIIKRKLLRHFIKSMKEILAS